MKLIARFTAFAIVVALSLACAPRTSHAGAAATPTAKNCYFVRNNLPCPCPRAQQARAVANAARITAGALGSAIGNTAAALTRAERSHRAPTGVRNASQPTQPTQAPKR